uniref:Centrosomal protein 128 n=1 Tax=Cyprinus carpio carpio TaxID=630221 RepID=A0A9J8CWK1_CYPCA
SMDSSSESDTYDRPTGNRSRVRKRRTRPDSGFPRDTHVSDISDKIDTLANTLQDTSRNLNKVDRMLGQYKEHTDGQAEAMATLRESLEESIQHLQAQQLRRSTGGWSASLSTLSLSLCPVDRRRYLPTSPLRDYGSAGTGNRRRSRSVGVRFTDSAQIHSLHQSLRDLQSDQFRIGDDIDREIRRRNRYFNVSNCQKLLVSLRVERRLQEIEDEMRMGRQVLSERHHREKPKSMSGELQEVEYTINKLFILFCELYTVFNHCVYVCFPPGRIELEREIEDLRVHLGRISVSSEVEELKKSIERKEREKTQLAFRVEVCVFDIVLCKSFIFQNGFNEVQFLHDFILHYIFLFYVYLIFSVLQSKEREGILSQQLDGARQQLADALGHLAQREEDVRRCNVDLTETRSQLVTLELELQEARETLRGLEEEAQKQISLQVRMREENIRLQKHVELQEHSKEEEQRSLLDLQASVKNLSAARADLAARLAEMESSKKDLEKQLAMAQEESSSFGRQLELERQVHQKELSHLRMTQQEGKAQQDRDVHDMLRLYQREREELEALIRDLKLCSLEEMKTECDKLTEQLSTSEENHAKLLHKYHALKKELDRKLAEREEERRQSAEHSMEELHERVMGLKMEQESILHAVGTQIDSACQFLSKDSMCILIVPMSLRVQTKLQWLCEEVREREYRERKLRRTLQQDKEQMKALKQSKDSELQSLLDRITLQDRLLKDIQSEKRGTNSPQRKVITRSDFMGTRLALDHLESVPEKLSLLENFKDLEESQRQREMVEQRYAKYKEIVDNLQHQSIFLLCKVKS